MLIFKIALIASLATLLAGAGGNHQPDTTAPTAAIHFPAAGAALTEGSSMLVTGTASDDSMITRVTVAGTDATSTDGFASWRAVVPLTLGDNVLSVETTDEFSNIEVSAAALTVEFNGPYLRALQGIALDAANGRALLVDQGLNAVVAVDLTSGVRTLLSDNITPPDAAISLISPRSIALDAANGRALVVDSSLVNNVVAVDLASGVQTILSGTIIPDALNPPSFPQGIALDAANGQVLVIDAGKIVSMDLSTGARTILSNETTPDTLNPFNFPIGIAVDTASGRALVVDSNWDMVVAVELTSGDRVIVSK